MAYSAGYPVIFTPAGDETKDAIYKHIQEIAKIYEHLNDMEDEAGQNSEEAAENLANAREEITEEIQELGDSVNETVGELAGTLGDALENNFISSVKVGDTVIWPAPTE
jgi:gas vesicle protein